MTRKYIFLILLMVLFLPSLAMAKKKPRVSFETQKWVYIIAHSGETFESISSSLRLDPDNLRLWNGVGVEYVLEQGDILKIEKEFFKKKKKKKRRKKKKKKKKIKKSPTKEYIGEMIIASKAKEKDVLEAIRFASSKTGVRPAFLAGMFKVETGMGGNTGTAHHKRSRMGREDRKVFLKICKRLRLDPNKTLVSAPRSGQRGGAMGVAQFMPRTWEQYRARIKRVVGEEPNPWNPDHAAIAMALKVSNDAPGVKSKNNRTRKAAEMNAAKMYLSGTTDGKYDGYAKMVLGAAKKFEKIL